MYLSGISLRSVFKNFVDLNASKRLLRVREIRVTFLHASLDILTSPANGLGIYAISPSFLLLPQLVFNCLYLLLASISTE